MELLCLNLSLTRASSSLSLRIIRPCEIFPSRLCMDGMYVENCAYYSQCVNTDAHYIVIAFLVVTVHTCTFEIVIQLLLYISLRFN